MPTGIFWSSSTNNPHSPIPNDGYAYMVYCLSNFFQIAYRITDAPSTIRALQRYCRDGVWQVWMDSFVTNNDFTNKTVINNRGIVTTNADQPLALWIDTTLKTITLYLNGTEIGIINYT